jgi:hypothetical protein
LIPYLLGHPNPGSIIGKNGIPYPQNEDFHCDLRKLAIRCPDSVF